MFHPDNIKNKQAQTAISISLYNYWYKWGGPKGLAQRLKTNIKVGRNLVGRAKFRSKIKSFLSRVILNSVL